MKEIVKKIKSLPKWIIVIFSTMILGAIGGGVLSIFSIELGTMWRNIYFFSILALSYSYFYKPFKKGVE